MAKKVYMPVLGMNQDTGTLLRWFKQEGESVVEGEPLMEVATDKTEVEIEAPASGLLSAVTAQAGDEVPVGEVMALILAPGETPPAAASPTPASPAEARQDVRSSEPTPVTVSPVAARMAAEHGLELAQINAPGGRIQKEDVLAYLAQQQASPARNGGRVLASPKARRLAAEQQLDLAAIAGSGPEGAVLAADLLGAARQQAAAVAVDQPGEQGRRDDARANIHRAHVAYVAGDGATAG